MIIFYINEIKLPKLLKIVKNSSIIVDGQFILNAVFNVAQAEDNANVFLGITGSGLSKSLTNPIVLNFIGCETVITKSYALGDVNDDGSVTNADVLMIYRYIYNATLYPLDINVADVNKDGYVTNADVLKIYRYIYNPTLYPLG